MELSFEMLPNAVNQLLSKVDNLERLLLEKGNPDKSNSDKMFDVEEAAKFCRLSKPTIYARVSKGEIPYNKKGKRLYFLESELMDWIKQGRRKTQAELAEDAQNYIAHNKKKRG